MLYNRVMDFSIAFSTVLFKPLLQKVVLTFSICLIYYGQ